MPTIDWQGRFAEFVARKEREALGARIPPLTTAIDLGRGERADVVAIGNAWTRRLFDGLFYTSAPPAEELPATSLVFVQSRDGNTAAKDPSALGGGAADKHLIYEGLSRVSADGVMAGGETMRSCRFMLSTWHPELVGLRTALGLPRHPIQIIATRRGLNFEGWLLNVPEVRVLVITVSSCADLMLAELARRPWIATIVMPASADLAQAFRRMREAGIRRVSCVGGRTLAAQLIDARLVQDLYLTTSPKEGGEPDTPLYRGTLDGEVIVRKHGTGEDAGAVFEHKRLI